ncbi:phosphate ABC transporter permease [Jeotgalibacillus malaysiensis]|uniref:Phosphate ABC transporter permease n=1 Tax=Jeotgalibacillus malaysiensis TaxID=1508404 RepID=A0A0B5AP69_9BACL|nr:HPr family phosphocarrier protein [Jeotgalibacillus malaysiensis]AJD92070.1 phosphate ABC transporter permease [Jeotgalibacillus malaysiensis]
MQQKEVTVRLKSGLQARPASMFVQEATKFSSDVYIEKENKKVNAKSIMGLMSLALSSGESFTLITDGADEEAAMQTLAAYVEEEK